MNLLTHRRSYAIALCLLGKSAVFAPTAFAAPIDTYPGFLSADEVEHFASSVDVDKEGIWHEANKGRGVTTFDPALFERLLDVTCTQLTAEEQHQMQYLRSIPVTKITGNTHVHVDRHHDSGEPVEGKAAFIVLNENPHATFVHGSTDVHAEAGDLVVFDADVPHNTQVARGTLSLVGPVDLRRLTPVGGGSSPTGSKGSKGAKSPKSPKAPKASKGSKGEGLPAEPCGRGMAMCPCTVRRMQDLGDRELTLQYMTDRFKEEGSVRSFVDSLGYEVDLNSGTGEKDNALSKEDCESLMSLIDHDSYSNVEEPEFQDIQKYVDESDLVSVIGKVSGGYHCLCLPLNVSRGSFKHIRSDIADIPVVFLMGRANSTPCSIFTKKLSGLPFLSKLS